jgi:exopolysaccharide biosynthesis polyprenyl glycosylphosphotransferase
VGKWSIFVALVPVWVLLLAPSRRLRIGLSLEQTWRTLLGATATVAGAYLLAYFYAPRAVLPRLPALYFLWEAALLTLAWRLCYLYTLSRGFLRRRALLLGDAAAAERMAALLAIHAPDTEVVARFDPTATVADASATAASETALDDIVRDRAVGEILLARRTALPAQVLQSLVRWQEQGVDVIPMTSEYEQALMRVPIAELDPDWMFTSLPEWVRARDASRAVKRLVDVVGGLAGLALLAVCTPVIAAISLIDSGRPVFYRQRRLGAGGRTFDVIKFRTMIHAAESDGPKWAVADDPRVTPVGRWLRRSRLDELPQVISVLRGDMSIVGPRPERPEFVEQLERAVPFYRSRLMVRPGVTGWAQVNTPYGDSVDGAALKLEYDLYYIKHRSFLFDAWIVLRTVGTVMTMGGR